MPQHPPAFNFRRSRQDEGDARREIDRLETDRLFNARFGFGDDQPGLREDPANAIVPSLASPELGFAGEDRPEADFKDLFLNQFQIGPRQDEVSFADVEKAGGIEGVQAEERFKKPVLREINDVISNLLGKASPTQRSAPTKISGFQKGMLFVADFVAMSEGRQPPSTQLALQIRRASTLEDQQNRQRFIEGISALDSFTKLIGGLDLKDRQEAAAGQIERARETFGEGFGGLLFALASNPSLNESYRAFSDNQEVFENGSSDNYLKYVGFLFAAGETDKGLAALKSAFDNQIFEKEAQFFAPALLSNKMDGFLAQLRDIGGEGARFANLVDSGGNFTPSDVINWQLSLPINSSFKFDQSVLSALAKKPQLFAAVLPGMVTSDQQAAYQEMLDAGLLSAPENFIAPKGHTQEGQTKSAPSTSAEARRLMRDGWLKLDRFTGLGGPGALVPTFKDISNMRQEFLKQSLPFTDSTTNFNTVVALMPLNTPAGDMGMIFAVMKTLDPTSVVREAEQEVARKTGKIPDSLWKSFQWLQQKSGRTLSPDQKRDFFDMAHAIWERGARRQIERENTYEELATLSNIPEVRLVVRDVIGELRNMDFNEVRASAGSMFGGEQAVPPPQPSIPPSSAQATPTSSPTISVPTAKIPTKADIDAAEALSGGDIDETIRILEEDMGFGL